MIIGVVAIIGGIGLMGYGLLIAFFAQESARPIRDLAISATTIVVGVAGIALGLRAFTDN
tara:strand:+ start:377 stop:556 length:180 start_codon:yes stop_codon:yes gene_type:complete